MPLGMEIGFVPGDIVLDGDPAPPPKKKGRTAAAPTIRPMSIVTKWMDQYAIWYGGRPQPRAHCVTWGLSSPKKAAQPPPIFGHVFWDQTTGWMKVALGTEVGLSPGNIVLDRDPVPRKK